MNPLHASLVSTWLALQYTGRQQDTRPNDFEALFPAFDEVYELCSTSPDEAWNFILAAWRTDQSSVIAENLSAGPLEDLLAKHGDLVIDRVEAEAKRDPTFAFLLGGVWRNAISEAVWSRVSAIRNRQGWDGIPGH
jgi:hypothetical protein